MLCLCAAQQKHKSALKSHPGPHGFTAAHHLRAPLQPSERVDLRNARAALSAVQQRQNSSRRIALETSCEKQHVGRAAAAPPREFGEPLSRTGNLHDASTRFSRHSLCLTLFYGWLCTPFRNSQYPEALLSGNSRQRCALLGKMPHKAASRPAAQAGHSIELPGSGALSYHRRYVILLADCSAA